MYKDFRKFFLGAGHLIWTASLTLLGGDYGLGGMNESKLAAWVLSSRHMGRCVRGGYVLICLGPR